MPLIRDFFRNLTTGSGIADRTVSLRRHSDDVEIDTTSTSTDGSFSFTVDYDEGDVYYMVDDGSGNYKRHSSKSIGRVGPVWLDDWRRAMAALGTGVASGLAVSADGSGMSVSVALGIAWLKDGVPYAPEAAQSVTITTADATNPRIDRIVIRLTRPGQTSEGAIELIAVAGTPAASPAAPALTQTTATWDITLAQVRVDAAASVIASNKVTDERTLAGQEIISVPLALSTITDVTATADELNLLDGVTSTTAELNILDGVTATAAELNVLDGITPTVTELNYVNGVTSAIQTQLDGKYSTAGGVLTGPISTSFSITANANANLGASVSSSITTITGHFRMDGGTFGTTVGSAAGTGGSVGASRIRGGDQAGEVQVITGASGTGAGALVEVSFASTRPDTDYIVILQPSSINAADLNLSVADKTTGDFEIRANVAPGTGETLNIQFFVVEVA